MVVHPFWRETAFSAAPLTGKRREDAHQLRHEPDINTQRSTNYVTQRFITVDGVGGHPLGTAGRHLIFFVKYHVRCSLWSFLPSHGGGWDGWDGAACRRTQSITLRFPPARCGRRSR